MSASPASDQSFNGWRTAEEIQHNLDFRKRRALAHFEKVVGGVADRDCPICGYHGPFSAVRHKVDVWCPSCDSRSRHRLIALWLAGQKPIAKGARVLHFAAEESLQPAFRAVAGEYVTADLNDLFDIQLNIEAMDIPDASFDVLIANHVLEHVDDEKALADIARVLKPGGFALITVPMIEGWDIGHEDLTITDPAERTLVMSDPDHRRWYGRDIKDKIERAGLVFDYFTAVEPEVTRCGLARGEKIFLGRKPGPEPVEGANNG
ncbi:MAG: class I SAM-dependent methyltransferase [Pikeienuella sp.]